MRRRLLKNKTEKLFMKRIRGTEGSELPRKLPLLKEKTAEEKDTKAL